MLMTAGAAAAQDKGMAGEGDRQIDDGFSPASSRRARAFRAAARHSALVKWLRRAILIGAVGATVGIVWYSYFRTEDMENFHLSLDRFGISGDKITMEHPRLTGLRRDGKPYDVTAESGVQNPKDPTRTVLNKLDAKLRMADDSETQILGDTGTYDSTAQVLNLSGNVRIKGANFVLSLRSATMNFKTNIFHSDEPVRLDFADGWVSADHLLSAENGEQITFSGDVKSEFTQPPQQAPGAPQKDSTQ
jgi:lipopolysaccharide export system protein LptC